MLRQSAFQSNSIDLFKNKQNSSQDCIWSNQEDSPDFEDKAIFPQCFDPFPKEKVFGNKNNVPRYLKVSNNKLVCNSSERNYEIAPKI